MVAPSVRRFLKLNLVVTCLKSLDGEEGWGMVLTPYGCLVRKWERIDISNAVRNAPPILLKFGPPGDPVRSLCANLIKFESRLLMLGIFSSRSEISVRQKQFAL
nr:hypothetical protein Iba_chr04dCG4600 [Ipomoea batatas]